jgi:agmatinase
VTRLALVGFRSDSNSSYLRGAAEAPPLIRAAMFSESSNTWTEAGVELPREAFYDAGDLGEEAGADTFARIEGAIAHLLAQGHAPVSLGGDHAITYPILRAFAKAHPRLSILHFDAHPDLYDEFEGNRHSHACPFARIMENGLAKRLVQVGIRTANPHQRAQAARFGVEMIEMKDFRDDLVLAFQEPVYVTIDMDGLDPSCAPGVSHREPGGLTTRQVLDVIRRVRGKIVGADLVEFNPRMDSSGMTAMVAAKLVKEMAGRILAADPTPVDVFRQYTAAVDRGDVGALADWLAEDFRLEGAGLGVIGRDEFVETMRAQLNAFPDYKVNPTDVRGSGENVEFVAHVTGTQKGALHLPGRVAVAPTGRTIALPPEPAAVVVRAGRIRACRVEPVPGGGIDGILSRLR